jgi:hypothetical protein
MPQLRNSGPARRFAILEEMSMADQQKTEAPQGAEEQSRSDLRDERRGAADPVSPSAGESQPEGLTRERKDPLNPRRGRAEER